MPKRQSIDNQGSGNVIVQAAGDNIRVEVGAAHLVLTPWERRASIVPAGAAQLLAAYRRAIPLIGRDRELAELAAWADSDRPVAILALTGSWGTGKTRLVIELMERLTRREERRWQAGFVTAEELRRFAGQQNLSEWGWQAPTLAVVDYAATGAAALRTWFLQLADHATPLDGNKLRLLLLEREAAPAGGWWASLAELAHRGSAARLAEALDPPMHLSPLDSGARRAVLQAAVGVAASLPEAEPGKSAPVLAESPALDRQLEEERWGNPLSLMMAAFAAPGADPRQSLALGGGDLALQVASREAVRIAGFAPEGLRTPLLHLAAFATLCRGLSRPDARDAARGECGALGWEWPGGPGRLVEVLHDALPGAEGAVGFVEPDIVGEAFLVGVLGSLDPRDADAAVVRAAGRDARSTTATVVRTVQDFHADDRPGPMRWLNALIREGAGRAPGFLDALDTAMPEHTLALREPAAEVSRLLAERLRREAGTAPAEERRAEIARMLNNLAVRLGDLGRREEALDSAQEAADLYRRLAQARPDVFLPYLAGSLSNLATKLSELGTREEALDSAQEAADLYRRLAQACPDAFLPDRAMSLINLAGILSSLGMWEEALSSGREAASIYAKLAEACPDAYRPAVAMSLNNLASTLCRLGKRKEALGHARKAERLYRELAITCTDAFLPDLAMSLSNLAGRLNEMGRQGDAVSHIEQAVQIYHRLAHERPSAFRPRLADSLNTLTNTLLLLGKSDQAIVSAQEAVRIRDQLAKEWPDALLPDLAMSLNNLAIVWSALGVREQALANARKAAGLYRQMAKARPDAFLPDLARSLTVEAGCLRGARRSEEACDSAMEALRAIMAPLQRYPAAFAGLGRAVLGVYTQCLSDAGREPDPELLAPLVSIPGMLEDAGKEEPDE